ncbi:MAG: putative lipid II flippase FtsW [Opitutales bacterium]|nr:putative lipid II flippase FtsW [Opitutales bacterium]
MPESELKSEKPSKTNAWLGIVIPVAILSVFGVISLLSAGEIRGNAYSLVQKQAIWLGVAVAVGVFTSLVPLNFWRKAAPFIAAAVFILLVLVLIPGIGKEVKGSRRWLQLGGSVIQPSDMAKAAIVIWLSAYLQHFQRSIKTFLKGVVAPSILIGLFLAPIVKEPDFGTTALCGAVAFAMLFMVGVKIKHVAPFVVAGAAAVATLVALNPNRMARLFSFLHREEEALGGGYQLTQAIYAFGSGGVFGVGLGEGRQQYSFLPEAHTDFIFANIAEEWGLVGTISVLVLFFIIFLTAASALKKAPNVFEYCMALGAALMITIQALFNMGVVTGLLPTKGISLPFLSYGGSNLVVMFFFSGILVNCIRSWNAPKQIKATDYE